MAKKEQSMWTLTARLWLFWWCYRKSQNNWSKPRARSMAWRRGETSHWHGRFWKVQWEAETPELFESRRDSPMENQGPATSISGLPPPQPMVSHTDIVEYLWLLWSMRKRRGAGGTQSWPPAVPSSSSSQACLSRDLSPKTQGSWNEEEEVKQQFSNYISCESDCDDEENLGESSKLVTQENV